MLKLSHRWNWVQSPVRRNWIVKSAHHPSRLWIILISVNIATNDICSRFLISANSRNITFATRKTNFHLLSRMFFVLTPLVWIQHIFGGLINWQIFIQKSNLTWWSTTFLIKRILSSSLFLDANVCDQHFWGIYTPLRMEWSNTTGYKVLITTTR